MLMVEIWGLPLNQSEKKLNQLHKAIVNAAVKELPEITNEDGMDCFFPPDLMKYGLGKTIIVKISGLERSRNPERSESYYNLTTSIGKAVNKIYSKSKVRCFIQLSESSDATWTSPDPVISTVVKQTDRTFKIGNSFEFAIQIPDNTVGCSGSKCSNCGNDAAYCDQVCQTCRLPFIGPHGFPQLPTWQALSSNDKLHLVETIYGSSINEGRLGYDGISFVPLTLQELEKLEKTFESIDHERFYRVHRITLKELREKNATSPEPTPVH
jgi:hypothetical protein